MKVCLRMVFLIVLAMAQGAGKARSESLCDGLKTALKNAEERFVPLRSAYDFDLTEYKANVAFGAATECATDSGNGVSELRCTQYFENLDAAHEAFSSYIRDIQNCFGRGVTLRRSTIPFNQRFQHEETTDDIGIRVGVIKHRRNGRPSLPYLAISVQYIDPTVR